MRSSRSLVRDRASLVRALAAVACASSAAVALRTDAPATSAGFADRADVSVTIQAPDLPAFVPGLVLWLDGSDTARQYTDTGCSTPVTTAGDPVRCWHDARVNGPSVVADSSVSPTQRTGGINGRSTVRLARDGGTDATLVAPDVLGGTAPDLQVFVVSRENVRGDGALLGLDGTASGPDRRLALQAPAADGLWYWDAGTATADRAVAGPTTLGSPTLATLWKDPATGTNGLRVNGVHTGTSPGRSDASTTGGVRIGTGITDHDVAEILVYDRRLSTAQEAAIEAYLAAKWSIPVGADAPGGVIAAASGDRAITLTWQPPADDGGSPVTDYLVQYRALGAGTWTTFADGTSAATSATVTGLTLATTYELRVAAVTSPGTGAWSSVASAQALAAWTPADLASGVDLWLDAADATTLSVVNGQVTAWRDRSGLGRDVAQADPAEQPAYQATGFGGRPALDFTNDRLRTTISGSTPSNWTVHAALDVDAGSGLRYVIDAETGRFVAATSADPSFAPALYNGSAWVGATAPATGPQVLGWVAEGPSAAAIYRNGSALATGLAYPTPRAVNGPVSIGGHNTTPSYYLDGRLSEVVMTASAAAPADRQRVEGYLAHKWGTAAGLPADHPYKLVPPLTVSPATTPGVPAAVTAVPGDGTIAVSWTAPSSGGSPIRDYAIDYRVDGTTPWLTAADGVSTTTTAAITGLTNGTAYEVRVRAATAAGTGASSAATAAVTPRAYRDAVLGDSPTGWWRLGEPSGTTAYSETGGRSATYQGTTTLQNAGALAGDADRAANLANTGWAEVPVANAPSLGTSSFTLEAWVRPGSQGGPILDRFLYTGAGTNGHQGFTWKLNACDGSAHSRGRCPFLRIWDPTSSNDIQLSTTALPASTWAHLALTVDRSANTATLYVNGVAAATRSVPLTGNIDVDLPLRIGTKTVGPVERFDGVLDEVAVYPSVLSAARIAAHHRAGLSGTNDGVAPATPTGLTATPGDAQVTLTWNVAPDADLAGYRLFRDGVLVRQQTGTTFTDTGLTNGTASTYTVEAYDTRGNRSAASTAVSATPRTVPGAPTSLVAQAGDTAVALTWNAPVNGGSPITDYVIEVRPSGGSWSTFADGTSTTTSAVVTGLTTGTTYDFRVAAVNALGTGATSTTATATPQPAWTPADLSAGLGFWFDAADASTITLDGGAVSEWRDRSGNGRTAVQATAARRPVVEATGMNNRPAIHFDGTDDQFSLPANAAQGTAFTLVTAFRPVSGPLYGEYPSAAGWTKNFIQVNGGRLQFDQWAPDGGWAQTTTSFSNTSVVAAFDQTAANQRTIHTNGTSAASSTEVYAGTAPDQVLVGARGGTSPAWYSGRVGELLAVPNGLTTADRQRVEGYLAHKWGTAASLPANHPYRLVPPTTATPATAPGAPGTPAAVPTDGGVQLTWTAPASNGGTVVRDYVVQYATDSAFTTPVTFADGVTTTAATTITGLTNGTAYWFRVAAVNAAGTGSWSTAATATPSTLWTPANLGGLALWLDAADSSTVVQSAGSVSQWNDKSGNGRHAVQTTAANQPAYDAAGLNSRGAIVWPNVANGRTLTVPAFAAQDWWFATRYADGTRSTWIAGNQGLFAGANTSESFIGLIAAGSGSATYANGGYPTGRINGGAEASMLGRTILPMPASVVHSRRADALLSSAGWNLGLDRTYTSLNRGWSGPIGEVVVTGSAPSDADRQRLEGYLAHKWGTTTLLPADHPYKTAPPRVGTPTAPTAVSAASGDGQLVVTWTGPDAGYGLSDYTVQYRTSPSGTWTTFADGTSTATTATITGLTAATTYDVRVAVIGAAGTSAWSATATAATTNVWTPADLTGVVLWLDAADSSTLTLNGPTVSQWSDKSGNARHLTQATSSRRPTPVAAAQNGRNVLRFDGGDALSTTAFPTTGWTGLTVFTTARWTTTGNSTSQIQALVDNNHDATSGFVLQDRPDLASRPLSGFVDDTAQTGNGTWRLIGATRSWGAPALNRLRVDGAQRSEATNTHANSFRNQFHVGAWNGTGRFLTGDIGDVLVVNGVLATADLQRVEGYLAHKWGTTASLPADHPYKSAPPRAGLPTAPTGLTAAGGDGSLSVSWAAPDAGYAITDYTVQYRLSPAGTWTTFADGTSATTGATITGLPASTAYDVRVAAIGAAGTSAWSTTATATTSTAWTPADLTGGMALWLDAADASTITLNGSTVSQWNDKSGNARHVSQGTAANQPTSTTSGLNGRNALSFAGSRWLGNTASSLTGTGTYTGPFNVFYAGAPGANGGTVLTERSSTLVGVSQWTNLSGTYFLSSDGANNSSNNQLTSATFARFSSAGGVVAHQHVPAARDNVWLNGTAETVTAGTAGNISGGTGFRIGTREFTGVGWDGSVGEIVVSTTALSTTDRQRLEGYLAHKWGTTASLPADHPYKSAPPRAGLPTAPAGFTATPGDTSIALTWTAPDAGYAVSDYVIEYRTSPSGSWTTFPDGTSTATSATVTGLTPGTAYDVRVAAVNLAGTGAWATATATPNPLWTPAQLTGVALWLDAADAATLTRSGSAVSQWSDKSGSGNHAVQATVVNQPTYNAATTGIDTGTSNWLGFDQQLLAGTTSASIFVAGNQTSGQSSWGHIGCCTNHHGPWSDGKLYDSFASNSRPGSTLALTSPWANTLTVLGYEQSGAALEFWQTGRSLGSAATTFRIPANTSSEQRLGPTYTNTYRLHEIVLVRSVLPVADRQRVEGYLAWKWGAQAQLPADHPYKLAAPRIP
jgi:hypothetical protein